MKQNLLDCVSLNTEANGAYMKTVVQAALFAAGPAAAVHAHVHLEGDSLVVEKNVYPLSEFERIFVIGAGKASILMLKAVVELLGNRISGGVIISKSLDLLKTLQVPDNFQILQGSHPVPNENSVESTRILMKFVKEFGEKDLVICLISGGGSALMTCPRSGIKLSELQNLTQQLLASGADIGEINSLRKHLDLVKGGGLAGLVYPARLVTLILSDVVGSPMDTIASGPTVPDPSTFADALGVLEKNQLKSFVAPSILKTLEQGVAGKLPETLKQGDPAFEHVQNVIVSNNYQAAMEAVRSADQMGMNSMLVTSYLQGEAREAGKVLASILREEAVSDHPLKRPICLVFGGETTVTLRGNGLGGRNTELALGAVQTLSGLRDVFLISLATDGEDGPTDAAGAVVSGNTLVRGQGLGVCPLSYLQNNDSYRYFDKLGDLIRTGPTGTNVNDLVFLFAF